MPHKIEVDHRAQFDILRSELARETWWLASALHSIRGPFWRPGMLTAAISSRGRLFMDPALFDTIANNQIKAILEHEVWHVLMSHGERAKAADVTQETASIWGIAADAVINSTCLRSKTLTKLDAAAHAIASKTLGRDAPASAWVPSSFGAPDGLTEEEYYVILLQQDADGGQIRNRILGPSSGSASDGYARDWERPQPGDPEDVAPVSAWEAQAIAKETAKAIEQGIARGRGDMPAGLKKWAEGMLAPPLVDWRGRLRRTLQQAAIAAGRADYSYRRPSRRDPSASRGYISPGMIQPRPDVAAVIDTSGSMSNADLLRATSEVIGITRAVGGSVRVASCDVAATKFSRVRDARDVTLVGGGGTDMRVAIAAVERLRPKPQLCVVITDGGTPWPESRRHVDVMAVIVGDETCNTAPPWITSVVIPPLGDGE